MRCSPTLVVAGYGMVGHKVVEALVRSGGMERWRVVVVGEEPRPAYDRVNLTSYLSGRSAGELSVVDASVAAHPSVEVLVGEAVTAIDRSGLTKDRAGGHATDRTGAGHEREHATKPYELGEPFNLNIERTVRNAIQRPGTRLVTAP